jgi:hypothetical protein
MPTPAQITTAAAKLVPATIGNLAADAQADLLVYLRQYLYQTGRSGGYPNLATKISTQTGRAAATLQAALDNIDEIGSDVAALSGNVKWVMQENVANEMEIALFTMYEPVPLTVMGTQQSDVAATIRACTCQCRGMAHIFGCPYYMQPFTAPITRY